MRETLPECLKQFNLTLYPNFAPNDRPNDIFFLAEKADPSFDICLDRNIRFPNMS
jgi:hypothetical protein